MEKVEHRNREPGAHGLMMAQYDLSTGVVRATCSGFWSLDQANAFFRDWTRIINGIHRIGGQVSAFVDMSASGVQQADVADRIAITTSNLYTSGDAIAMLVPNSLAKMQMRRVLDARYHNYFISRSAAETWLAGRRSDTGREAYGSAA